MFGYSKIRHEVFVLEKKPAEKTHSRIELDTKLMDPSEAKGPYWRQLRRLQGQLVTWYLRRRYGGPDTRILLASTDGEPVHVEWIVPAHELERRYPFVSADSYSLISCLTHPSFRGLGIFPSQIQKVAELHMAKGDFFIWAPSSNKASLKAIRKAFGIKVGEFYQTKLLWGLISFVEYFPVERSSDERERT